MTKYKLTYFAMRGRAEVARYILAIAGVDYVDERIKEEDWQAVKPTVKNPFKLLPILEVDDKVLIESLAIENYLAATYGLHGNNNWEKYLIDMVGCAINDAMEKLMMAAFAPDETKREDLYMEYKKFIPVCLKVMEELIQENKSDYLVGNRLTSADLQFFCGSEYFLEADEKIFDNFPGLKGLFERVANTKQIADWRNKRPKTKY